jgi:rRNA maturation endonuclease Nob1
MLKKKIEYSIEEIEEKLFNKIGELPFYEITELFQKMIIKNALSINANSKQAAADYLQMNRTTLSEMCNRFEIVTYKEKIKPPQRSGFTRERRCRNCKNVFEGNAKKPCPHCGNTDKKTIIVCGGSEPRLGENKYKTRLKSFKI